MIDNAINVPHIIKVITIPSTGHTVVIDEEVAPTCTEQGYTTYTCACGDTYKDNYVDATGHSYTAAVTKAATCTEAGVKTFTCSCGDSYTEAIPATGKCEPKSVSNWILGDIYKVLNERKCEITDLALTPANLAEMISLIEKKTISNAAGKTVLEVILDADKDPNEIVKEKGLAQVSDTSALNAIVEKVLANNEKAVTDFKNGKTNVVGFLVGQCMKESKGKGNPAMLKDMVVAAIEKM